MQNQENQELRIKFRVNGKEHNMMVEPHVTLLEVIRDRLGLKGAKLSCDMEVCGACTVLLDGKPVSSCTTLALEARDKNVVTIEGLSTDGELHPLQESFINHGGSQCGFCTSGMILTAKSLLDEKADVTEEEIKEYMNGNLCRCTGYKMIVESIMGVEDK